MLAKITFEVASPFEIVHFFLNYEPDNSCTHQGNWVHIVILNAFESLEQLVHRYQAHSNHFCCFEYNPFLNLITKNHQQILIFLKIVWLNL